MVVAKGTVLEDAKAVALGLSLATQKAEASGYDLVLALALA